MAKLAIQEEKIKEEVFIRSAASTEEREAEELINLFELSSTSKGDIAEDRIE